jgi:hypothetical protein
MTIVQPTVKRLLLIWVSITIRALVLGVGGAIAASIIIGVVVAMMGGSDALIRQIAQIAGPVIGLPVSLYAVYAQLGRKCGDVRLVLISAE